MFTRQCHFGGRKFPQFLSDLRDYDSTKDVVQTITSSDIYESDKEYIKLSGKYNKVFGDSLSINLFFNNTKVGFVEEQVVYNLNVV